MIKKLIFALCITSMTTMVDAQNGIIDWDEDSTRIVTYNDIVKQQQETTTREGLLEHNTKVWGNRTFFNISYNLGATLTPTGTESENSSIGDIFTGLNEDGFKTVEKFQCDWGVSLKWGKNIRLHKKALANIVQFNIDYTWVDLSANHYKAVVNKQDKVYDSSSKNGSDLYFPWNLEKYNFTYGMYLGPSITLAPFTHIKGSRGLHFVKFNVYYHIGYNVAFLLCKDDSQYDMNISNASAASDMKNASKYMIGHGLAHAVGFNVSWKKIGLGWETRFGNLKYSSLDTEHFGSDKYKFKQNDSRIYLQLRF